ETAVLKPDRAGAAAAASWSVATDLADALARTGVPFHQAHRIVGRLVLENVKAGKSALDLTAADLCAFAPEFRPEMAALLDPRAGLSTREIAGGTGPKAVAAALDEAEQRLAKIRIC